MEVAHGKIAFVDIVLIESFSGLIRERIEGLQHSTAKMRILSKLTKKHGTFC